MGRPSRTEDGGNQSDWSFAKTGLLNADSVVLPSSRVMSLDSPLTILLVSFHTFVAGVLALCGNSVVLCRPN